jgi:protein SCO1
MRLGRPRCLLPALAALLALLLGAGVAPAADVEIGAPFSLTDQNGRTRTDSDFRGSYLLVYFGYTFCPDICPVGLMKMVDALALLETRARAKAVRVTPVFITIDPERDTPAKLKEYAGSFSPRLIALTGKPADVREVADGYGTRFAKAAGGEGGGYVMDHTGFTYLMGPDGRYLAHFQKDVTAESLADALAAHVAVPLEAQR